MAMSRAMSSVYVARQPIFEVGRGLYGYELLYRRDIRSITRMATTPT